jgi:hypothetical protein
MEESIPQMAGILVDVAGAIEQIAEVVREASTEIGQNTNPTSALATRLRVARSLASRLDPPSTDILSLGSSFSSSLNEVDEGVRIIIERSPEEARSNPETVEQLMSFFQTIRELVIAAEVGLGAVQDMIEQIGPLEKMSRDLRKPLRALREGLTLFVDGLTVMRGWVALIDATELLPPED